MQWLRKILFPFSLLYALIVYIRNWCYDTSIFKSKSFKIPIICIGNLSVGGTGKTPMAAYILAALRANYKVALLSRGYKRKSKGFLLANSNTTVEDLGDEPYTLHTNFPDVPVAVSANRVEGIQKLTGLHPDLEAIVLDDAFQHRKVTPKMAILLTAYNDLYCDDWYLPTGNLRDHKNQAKRANVVVVTKCPENLSEEEQQNIAKKLKLTEHQHLFFTTIAYHDAVTNTKEAIPLNNLPNNVTLVTGIANPKPLVDFLKDQKLIFEHLQYPDHHFFTTKELETLKTKEFIVTTEKDFVRLNQLNNVYYLPIKTKFLAKEEAFKKLLIKTVKS